MKYGFLKVGCVTPQITVGDCRGNANKIIELIDSAYKKSVKFLVLPELCVCGATCGDLFFQETLYSVCEECLIDLVKHTEGKSIIVCVGLPVYAFQRLYNCTVVVSNGNILGIVPKKIINTRDLRWFSDFDNKNTTIKFCGQTVPFGREIIFECKSVKNFTFAIDSGEDLFSVCSLSQSYAMNGANIIISPCAINDVGISDNERVSFIKAQSKRLLSACMFANAGYGESTTDFVFSGKNIIAENGDILALGEPFSEEIICTEVDLEAISNLRKKSIYFNTVKQDSYTVVKFDIEQKETHLTRKISRNPFIPKDMDKNKYFKNIFDLQVAGLSKRMEHIKAKKLVIGISGGLDSTQALLVAVKTMDRFKRSRQDIIGITMPCFGTSKRTYDNAKTLCECLGITFREVSIKNEAMVHFEDIGQDIDNHDVTFENAQARIRTLILMDIANQVSGLVVGTGDLSEIALGWSTYNGDHMSMYGVNATVPKTLMQELVRYEVSNSDNSMLKEVLSDIVDTPISPELLPDKDGSGIQSTESIIGSYELHDFFIYYMMKFNFSPSKIYKLAMYAFEGKYDKETVKKWLKVFYKRFFTQQFKRSCSPDAPDVTGISMSPRGGLFLPSDISASLWLEEVDKI